MSVQASELEGMMVLKAGPWEFGTIDFSSAVFPLDGERV